MHFGADIQKFSEKLPGFIWSKYPKEKHLPSYNYLGPGTRLDIRLDENNQPKSGEEPINAIDQLAYYHDLAYQNSNDLSDRHNADIQMINGLKQLKNLSMPQKLIRIIIIKLFQAKIRLGQSLGRLSKQKANEILFQNPDIKTKFELDKMTKTSRNLPLIHRKKLADELHRPYRKPKELRKIKFKSKDNIWNADLVIMPIEDGFVSKGVKAEPYKYILTVMDGFTRFAWAVPLKHKDGLSVSNAFKEIIKKSKRKPNKLFVDEGKEFYNSHMYSLFKFKKEDILEKDETGNYKNQIYSVFNFGKNPVIERFNRTLTNKLWKKFTINENQKWLKILQPTINEYNNSIHRTINTTPNKASKDPSLVKVDSATKRSDEESKQ